MPHPDQQALAQTQTWLAGALERFAADNDDVKLPTRSVLAGIVGEPARHARLLNTLSMLEHLGSHKIMVTQHAPGVDQPTLRHVAEEAHHAYFMKRQAEKVAGKPMAYVRDDLLAPAAARMYFQRLEAAMLRTLGKHRSAQVAYLYMSMIVEFRALWFYRLYQHTLQRARAPLTLKRVIGEEENHLNEIANRLDSAGKLDEAHVATFLTAEKRLYGRLLAALQQ